MIEKHEKISPNHDVANTRKFLRNEAVPTRGLPSYEYLDAAHSRELVITPKDIVLAIQTYRQIQEFKQQYNNNIVHVLPNSVGEGSSLFSIGDAAALSFWFYTQRARISSQELFARATFPVGVAAYNIMFGSEDDLIDDPNSRQSLRKTSATYSAFNEHVLDTHSTRFNETNRKLLTMYVIGYLNDLLAQGKIKKDAYAYILNKFNSAHELWLRTEYESLMHPETCTTLRNCLDIIVDTAIIPGQLITAIWNGDSSINEGRWLEGESLFAVPATILDSLLDVGQDLISGTPSVPIAIISESNELPQLKRLLSLHSSPTTLAFDLLTNRDHFPVTSSKLCGIFGVLTERLSDTHQGLASMLKVLTVFYPLLSNSSIKNMLPVSSERTPIY